MFRQKPILLSLLINGVLFLGFSYWYDWGAAKLSPAEVSSYMEKLEQRPQVFQKPGALAELRQFLLEDDGQAFYTVNLYKYFDVARYSEGVSSLTGREAYDKFAAIMIPLQLARGSHPIFGTNWMSENSSGWDRLVIVRYRSRRDIVDMFASDGFLEASLHKWAALEEYDRHLAQGLHIPAMFFPAFLLLLVNVALVAAFLRRKAKRGAQPA